MLKGLKVERAKPSNAIDIFALLGNAAKEGVLEGKPNERQMKNYYFTGLLQELSDPLHLWLLARRGRGYVGFLHAVLLPGRWDGGVNHAALDLVFVPKEKRKRGIGRKLLEELKKEVENMGIKRIEFVCPGDQAEKWQKEYGAKVHQYLMGVDL